MVVALERFAYTPMGTFGTLTVDGFSCYTVERPWEYNEPFESCIPEGEYTLKRSEYHRGGYPTYEVMDVPGRTLIKVHVANTMLDVYGCIGVGRALGYLNGMWAVKQSQMTFDRWMETMDEVPEATLIISHFELGRTVILRGTVDTV